MPCDRLPLCVGFFGLVLVTGCGLPEEQATHPQKTATASDGPTVARRLEELVRSRATEWDFADCQFHPRDLALLGRKASSDVRVLRLGRWADQGAPRWEWLARFTGLRELYLGGVPLDDRGLQAVSRLPHLRVLNAGQAAAVTDRGLQALAALQQLELLRLVGCRIGAPGLRHVARLPRLKALILDQVPLDAEGYGVLLGMKQLDSLYLYRTGLSEEQLQRLGEVVPHVHW